LEILVNPDAADAEPGIGEVTAAAQTLGQRIQVLSASGDAAIETAFATLAERGVRGLFISPNAFFTNRREQIIALAARYVVPALYGWREYVVSGGTSLVDAYWQVGAYTGRILHGAKPADLPVIQPTRFELVINLKTAKALDLTVPLTLQVAADEVIE
jgi:putative tryptophan/tyrosine transport system substrate-binding protein